jgi:hypothetical protein
VTNKVTQTKLAMQREASSYTSKKTTSKLHKQTSYESNYTSTSIYENKYKLALHEGKQLRRWRTMLTRWFFSRGSLGCHQATSPLCRPTLRGSTANRSHTEPLKRRHKNPPSSVVAQWHAQLELLFVIPVGWAQSPHKSFFEASHNLLASFDRARSHQAV